MQAAPVAIRYEGTPYLLATDGKEVYSVHGEEVRKGIPLPWGFVEAQYHKGALHIGGCNVPIPTLNPVILWALFSRVAVYSCDMVAFKSLKVRIKDGKVIAPVKVCTPDGETRIDVAVRDTRWLLPTSCSGYAISVGIPADVFLDGDQTGAPEVILLFKADESGAKSVKVVNQVGEEVLYTVAELSDYSLRLTFKVTKLDNILLAVRTGIEPGAEMEMEVTVKREDGRIVANLGKKVEASIVVPMLNSSSIETLLA